MLAILALKLVFNHIGSHGAGHGSRNGAKRPTTCRVGRPSRRPTSEQSRAEAAVTLLARRASIRGLTTGVLLLVLLSAVRALSAAL